MKKVVITKDAIWKGKKLSEMEEKDKRKAESALRMLHRPQRIEIVYE